MEKVSRKFSFRMSPAPSFPITNVLGTVMNLMDQVPLSSQGWQQDSLLVLQISELGKSVTWQFCCPPQFSFIHLVIPLFSFCPEQLSNACPSFPFQFAILWAKLPSVSLLCYLSLGSLFLRSFMCFPGVVQLIYVVFSNAPWYRYAGLFIHSPTGEQCVASKFGIC